jgi:nicotinic acid mononucleotide adenylyltransferase
MTRADAAGARTTPGIVLLTADTPDVSSTDIRAHASRNASLTGLVTEPVEQYIRRHGLYV